MAQNNDDAASQVEPEGGSDETRQRILEAAAQTFAEQGYARATTRALAAAAGVNEVTLFRHFGSKEKLFAAVIDEYAAGTLATSLEGQLSGDYGQDMMRLGKHFIHVMLERGDAARMMLCEAAHFPEVREVLVQNPRQLRQMLAGYLRQQMVRGRVRQLDAEVMAQAFWGMFFAYGISLGILDEPVGSGLTTEEVAVQFVEIFVRGTAAEAS